MARKSNNSGKRKEANNFKEQAIEAAKDDYMSASFYAMITLKLFGENFYLYAASCTKRQS
jgi:hypothetical protein